MNKLLQQGDVLFFKEENLPEKLKKLTKKDRIVFAEGEATGHAHVTTIDDIEIYEDNVNQLWAEVFANKTVVHEEHKPVVLTPGVYRIGKVREIDPFTEEINSVRD